MPWTPVDVKPYTPVTQPVWSGHDGEYPLEAVAAVTGMTPSFVGKVVGKSRAATLGPDDVRLLLEQDAYHETFVPRSRILDYLEAQSDRPKVKPLSLEDCTDRMIVGSSRDVLDAMPDGIYQTIVTSTPYWAMRLYKDMEADTNRIFKSHKDVQRGLSSDISPIRRAEMKEVLGTVSFVAWRDGVVSLAWYGATQAMSLLCSAFLGLAETATYSVMLQFATAAHNFSSVYMHTYLPSFQSAYVKGDRQRQRDSVDRGMSCYLLMFLICTLSVTLVVLPILPLFKSDFICNPTLYLGLSVYCFLLNQHSLYCQFIVSMNEIPYFKAYLASTVAGVMLTCLLCGWMHWGAWGLILGQAIPQLCYNNWHWPQYVYKKIGGTYIQSISTGTRWFVKNITEVCKRRH